MLLHLWPSSSVNCHKAMNGVGMKHDKHLVGRGVQHRAGSMVASVSQTLSLCRVLGIGEEDLAKEPMVRLQT